MQVDVFNTQKKKVGTVELPDDIFAAEVSDGLLWDEIKAQLASRRRGTHKTKKRGEVSGGGIKPFKQKGSGRARQGSIRAPNHVGGGKVFGPVPRDYSYRLPRSARKSALRSALSLRAKAEGIVILDKLAFASPKTKDLNAVLGTLGLAGALLVDVGGESENKNLKLSARNLVKTKYVPAEAINVYDILNHDKLVLTQAAVDEVVKKARKASAASA